MKNHKYWAGRPHKFSLLALLSALILLPGLCRGQAPANSASAFRVGVIAPLSGVLAEYGQAAKNGIELAKVQHPELFSNIQFMYEDSQWDAKMSVSAFNKLRTTAGVSLIFNWGNPTTEAVAPLSESYRFPVIGMTLDPKVVRGRHFLIRSINPAADFASTLIRFLGRKGYQKIGVVLSENTYVQGLFNGLKDNSSPDQVIEVIASHNIAENDFRSTVLKASQQHLDALGVFLISGQISTFYRQLQTQGLSLPTFGTDFFESSTEIRLASGGMEGAVYTHLGVTPEFEATYLRQFKNDYQIAYAGNSYDMAVLIGTLFNGGSTPNAEEVMAKLTGPKAAMAGVNGNFHYSQSTDGDRYYEFPVQIKVIQDGKFKAMSAEPS